MVLVKREDKMTYAMNTDSDGAARTIKAQYAKTSFANLSRGGSFGATGAIAGGDRNLSDYGYRIRKLTPKECWRLMGFTDEDFYTAKTGDRELAKKIIAMFPNDDLQQSYDAEKYEEVSNSQLYKQAGNSIVTDVLFYIFKNLYIAMPYLFDDLKVGSYFSGIGAFEIALNRLFEWINNTDRQDTKSGGET